MTYVTKKIILTGYMGSGKTVIAQNVALKLSIPFFDLDTLIENEIGNSITQIFEKKGEIYFRKQEHSILKKFIKNSAQYVLSLGGGTPCYADNYKVFEQTDIISVYLKATPKTLANRLISEPNTRPLLHQINSIELEEFIAKHLFERNQYYRKATNIITIDNKSINEITQEILKLISH